MFKKSLFFLFSLIGSCVYSQNQKPILQDFQQQYIRFENEKKLDSINFLINSYLEKDNLQNIEKQLLYYYKGIHYTKINRYNEAIVAFKKSTTFENKFAQYEVIKNVTYYFIADAYFTLKDYKNAYIFAEKSKRFLNPDTYSNAFIDVYSIIGYYHFLQLDNDKSFENYAISKKGALKYNKCKVSEIDVKIARILSRKKEFYKAKETIDRAIIISDSCGEQINKINALKCLREILVENKKFEEAENTFESIEKLATLLERNNRDKKIDSLETAFKTKLKEQQNILLKKQNFKKESDLKSQRIALILTVLGIIILSILLYYVFQLSKKQKQTNKELERLNLLNQKIFSVISHDFKGPITTLKLMLSNKLLNNDDSPISLYINDIKNQLDQSEVMLNSLLDWAKAELLIKENINQSINAHDFIEENIKEFIIKLNDKNITVLNLIPVNQKINFDDSVLKIVFRNIINNAIKFSYENSEIKIIWHPNTIEILDFGKGIESEKLKKLFKKNINPGLGTNMETGFGLGLYLSSELMLKNGGKISAKSNEVGSSFYIHFSD